MEKTSYILAVDLGTSGCKSALISITGQVVGWEFQEVPLQVLPNGGAEQNPQDWWTAFLATSKRLIEKSLVPVEDIVAVCCSSQGEGTVAVDQDGNPLMNCILWMDMRGAKHLNQITQGLVNVAGYDPFKLMRWIRLTGGAPSLTGKDPAAHMLFIREEYPQVYQKTYKFLNVLDYINLCLTGRFVATPDSILTSWVTDNRDSAHVVYNEGLMRDCGVATDKFPEIVPCTQVIGELKRDVAELLGLKAGVKVIAGAIDTTSAAIGSGAIADYDAHLCIGTSSWIAAHMPVKKTDIGSSVASVPCAIPGKYLMIIMQTTAGGNLTFLRDKILYHKDELLREEHAPDVYKIMDRIAAKVPAGSNGLIYTPWIYGERSPVEDRTVRAAIINLSLENSREDIIRAFLEGVALNTRWLLAPTEKFLGRKLNSINMVGGGAKSDIWCQIFADVLNITIRQVCDPIQVNARGAAFIAAVGLGSLSFAEIPQHVQIQATYQPNPQNRPVYDKLFTEFVGFYKRNKTMYQRLNG
ncbi:MAG TPA: FGGY-family carbohydrate kinase [Anaerolineaceae bacterium]|nr:FGGY-family carbohydrate kinase [Anaerolineaceae bacterium]